MMKALNVRYLPAYRDHDLDSARCRANLTTIRKYFPGAKIGCTVRIKVTLPGIDLNGKQESFETLQTLWPDNFRCLEDDYISIGTVVCSQPHPVDWIEECCELLELIPARFCTSLKFTFENSKASTNEYFSAESLTGIPVSEGFFIHLPCLPETKMRIRRTNPGGISLINMSTILIPEKIEETSSTLSSTAYDGSSNTYSKTKIVEEIINRVIQPVVAKVPNVARFSGIMLLGPPGVGKSYAVSAVQFHCREICDVLIHQLSIPELLAEAKPQEIFQKKIKEIEADLSPASSTGLPRVIFLQIDEIDALGTARQQNETLVVIKLMLCSWMDRLNQRVSTGSICVLATSNRSEDIDRLFRRGGRLECELYALNSPEDRARLVLSYLRDSLLHNPSDGGNEEGDEAWNSFRSSFQGREDWLREIATAMGDRTGGYVAADIANLVHQLPTIFSSASVSPTEPREHLLVLLERAMDIVTPSCLRGVTISVPKISFDDIIGYSDAKRLLQNAFHFYDPVMKPVLARFGMSQSLGGILLHGPPGNSKTRLVRATAAVFRLPLIALTSADIYSAYVGDAEAEIRKAFTIARQASPCILFFDEMDSLVTNRDQSMASSSGSVEARVLATFLNEMDGISSHASAAGVIVMGATNRLDCIDPALIRKGRFYQVIHIPSPNEEERKEILRYFLKKYDQQGLLQDISGLESQLREGMSGAEIENLCKVAIVQQLAQCR